MLWDSQWFSGVPTLDYSVLSPAFGALTGPIALCTASGVASAFLFHRLVHRAFGAAAWVGSLWFATSTVTNLVVGRATFALGVAFALGALLALQRGHGSRRGGCARCLRSRVPRSRASSSRSRAARVALARPTERSRRG